MEKKSDNKIKYVVSSRWFLVIALVIAIFFAFIFARAYYQDYKVRQEIESLKEEVKSLETKKIDLLNLYKYVESDEFVEEKARLELNMKKPGENVLILSNAISDFDDDRLFVDENKQVLNNPIKWWYYFTHQEDKLN